MVIPLMVAQVKLVHLQSAVGTRNHWQKENFIEVQDTLQILGKVVYHVSGQHLDKKAIHGLKTKYCLMLIETQSYQTRLLTSLNRIVKSLYSLTCSILKIQNTHLMEVWLIKNSHMIKS